MSTKVTPINMVGHILGGLISFPSELVGKVIWRSFEGLPNGVYKIWGRPLSNLKCLPIPFP